MASSAVAGPPKTIAELRRQRDELADQVRSRTAERDEAVAQQTATNEILRAIARSPTDVRPVFEAIVGNAARLCEAEFSAVVRFDDGLLHLVAINNMSPEERAAFHSLFPRRPTRAFTMGRAFLEARAVQFDDVLTERGYDAGIREVLQPVAGYRTFLGAPILLDGSPIGVIGCGRREVKPFAAAQIELIQTFADQAAIALDNVRLFNELESRNRDLGEALAQQTATADVLQVINSSPGDLAPVFDAMLDKAMRLCDAAFGGLWTFEQDRYVAEAVRGVPPAYAEFLAKATMVPGPGTAPYRLRHGEPIVHNVDLAAEEAYRAGDPQRRALVDIGGARTALQVPLRKDNEILGVITIYRQEVRPFSDKQIALLQNFAAQAVIAMENARLLTETREALEQQTATAEVLQVINSSPGDLAPVFDAMLEKAMHLCGAAFGVLATYDGKTFRTAATRGVPAPYAQYRANNPPAYGPGTGPMRILGGERVVHVLDLMEEDAYRNGEPNRRALVDLGGARTSLVVPLLKDQILLGTIQIYRQEVRPFSDKQTALLQNFAAQAVIAMENARLITETRQALEKQTATAEILRVISGSPADVQPTFDLIAARATILCDAASGGVFRFDGDLIHFQAHYGWTPEEMEAVRSVFPIAPGPGSVTARAIMTRGIAHSADIGDDLAYAQPRLAQVGFHTVLSVPMLRSGHPLGAITVTRHQIEPFSGAQIDLIETFADQAVIAIENVRLFTELQQRTGDLQESLEYQTATSEVLEVISRSTFDLQPVLDTLVETAARLCNAEMGLIAKRDGDSYPVASSFAFSSEFDELVRNVKFEPGRGTVTGRAALERQVVHVADIAADAEYAMPEVITIGKMRTALGVPLLREGEPIGVIYLARQRVQPFTERQIELVRTFADQAVIAIENARLITETREALEQQTATAEVLQVINSSPGDLAPVFDAMLEKAVRLCDGAQGIFWRYDGEQFLAVAFLGVGSEFAAALREPVRLPPESPLGRAVHGAPFVQVPDMADTDVYRSGLPLVRAVVDLGKVRSLVVVPLIKDGTAVGTFAVARREVRPFTNKQIALLQNFAAQAVIAIENARLLRELRERTSDLEESLKYQTATSDVLKVISRSIFDLRPVLDTLVETAARLCQAEMATIMRGEGEVYRAATVFGYSPDFKELIETTEFAPERGSITGRVALGRRIIHVPDAASDPEYTWPEGQDIGKFRTMLGVPLLREDALIGVIVLARARVEPFTERQIELVRTFADQAVIAIENARLITETHEALEQQTATAEVLQVINSSPGDLAPVFDAMLDKALHLCEAAFGLLHAYDGERFRALAVGGMSGAAAEPLREWVPDPGSALERIVLGDQVVHIPDVVDTGAYRSGVASRLKLVELTGARTALWVALRKDDALLGVFVIYRREVRRFSDKQIALLQNFAEQAVIAMENARLLTETREALEYQTATSDVLKVISRSTFDLQPVLASVAETAARLCEAEMAFILRRDGEVFRAAAALGWSPEYQAFLDEHPILPNRGTLTGRVVLEGHAVQIADVAADPEYTLAEATTLGDAHTQLGVPLLRENETIGVIILSRRVIKPFTEKEVALVTTFADQAVIAIENARLLNDLHGRTEELMRREAELRVTFDNMGDGVVMFDEGLRLAAWNRNFQELLDLPYAVLGERPSYGDYLRILAERGEFGTDDIAAELARRIEDTERELRIERARPDGRIVEVRRNAVPGGGFVLIYSDITERKRAEAEIRAARDAAESALRELKATQQQLIQQQKMASLGQLTAGIAHEIKNPLNFVNNFAGLSIELLDELKETTAPALAALGDQGRADVDEVVGMLTGNLEKIAEHGRRADGIVSSMLLHSRGGTGERRKADLNNLVEEALNLAYHGARARDQRFNITLEHDFDDALAPIELVPQDLTRVFLNLIGNGLYAADSKSRLGGTGYRPVLQVATRDLGEAVEVRVRDNGTGIAPEIRDRLFQPFVTTKPTGEGTGLGLSISYDIVTQGHGGTIAVDSEPGEFTEFIVRLPRRGV